MMRIVAAVLDTSKLTLYGNDGATVVLPQGDTRIRRIIDEATPQLLATGSADVNMAPDVVNTFADFEEKSSKVRFYRVAKAKLKGLFGFGSKEEESLPADLTLGTIPKPAQPVLVRGVELVESLPTILNGNGRRPVDQSVIDEIMTHAVKATDPKFSEEGLDKQAPIKDLATGKTPSQHGSSNSTDTIIAVTSEGHVIPGMERIKTQFARAAKLGSPIGVERFLERIGSVITDRRHSVDDLLKFLERGDLPIAEDGCILIYKSLNRSSFGAYPQAKYADVHSSKVPQWIGARVMMAPELVDPNRRNECSNGLHVARRGYVGTFGGTTCVMAKLAPEDVIAVPIEDANKMRVCAYHILFELSSEQFSLLKRNRPLTEDAEGRTLLAKALAGHHTRVTHTVEITAKEGGGIRVTPVQERPTVKAIIAAVAEESITIPGIDPIEGVAFQTMPKAVIEAMDRPTPEPSKKKLAPADAIEDQAEAFDNPVDPKDVVKEVENLSVKGRAEALVIQILRESDHEKRVILWADLALIKKTSKYGWDRLGVPAELVLKMTVNPALTPTPKADPIPEPASTTTEAEAESFSKRINRLALITPMNEQTATSILNLKKQSKKSWATLKVSDLIAAQVVRLTTAK